MPTAINPHAKGDPNVTPRRKAAPTIRMPHNAIRPKQSQNPKPPHNEVPRPPRPPKPPHDPKGMKMAKPFKTPHVARIMLALETAADNHYAQLSHDERAAYAAAHPRSAFGETSACWKGYEQRGMKKKGKRMVPNCVKKDER